MENSAEQVDLVEQAREDAERRGVVAEHYPSSRFQGGSWSRSLVKFTAATGALFALLVAIAYWYFGSLVPAVAYVRGDRLLIYPTEISLGETHPGRDYKLQLRVWNFTGGPVKLLGAASTCACLTNESFPVLINERQSRALGVQVFVPRKSGNLDATAIYFTDWSVKPKFSFRVNGQITQEESH